MSDRDLRALERRFRETGALEDEAAWVQARLRAGDRRGVWLDPASLPDRLARLLRGACDAGRARELLSLFTGVEWLDASRLDFPWHEPTAAGLTAAGGRWSALEERGEERVALPGGRRLGVAWTTYAKDGVGSARLAALLLDGAPLRLIEAKVWEHTSNSGTRKTACVAWRTTRVCCTRLVELLRQAPDALAWTPRDLGGRPALATHHRHVGDYEVFGNLVYDRQALTCALDLEAREGVYLEWSEHDNSI